MGMRARRSPLKYRVARLIGHQHYIPHGRDRFIRLFAPPDRATSTAFTIDFFGQATSATSLTGVFMSTVPTRSTNSYCCAILRGRCAPDSRALHSTTSERTWVNIRFSCRRLRTRSSLSNHLSRPGRSYCRNSRITKSGTSGCSRLDWEHRTKTSNSMRPRPQIWERAHSVESPTLAPCSSYQYDRGMRYSPKTGYPGSPL